MPRSDSAHYLGNPKLKAAGLKTPFTMEHLRETQKCAADPIYFIKKYVKIVHVDRGTIPFALYPFQEKMIDLFSNNRFVIVKLPRQCGKCLVKNTRINIRDRNSGREYETTIEEFYKFHQPKTNVLGKTLRLLRNAFRPLQ